MRVGFMAVVDRLKSGPKRERGGTRPGSWPQAATMAKCPPGRLGRAGLSKITKGQLPLLAIRVRLVTHWHLVGSRDSRVPRGGRRGGGLRPQAAPMAKSPRAGSSGSDVPASVNHQVLLASPNATSSYLGPAATPVLDSGRVTRATTVRSRCLCRRCQCACARPTE
jgi:hypothetical protein